MIIDAVQTKEYEDTCMYTFTVGSEKIQVYYIYGKDNQSLEFFHNGISVDKAAYGKTITIDTEKGQINVKAWINRASSFEKLVGINKDGLGIEVNGIPVKSTITDPNEYMNQGRAGLGLLLFTLAARGVLTYISSGDINLALVFFIPALIVLVALVIYNKCLLLTLIIGTILAIIELLDYVTTIPGSLMQPGGSSMLSMSIIGGWLIFRVKIITGFYTAFKWRNEKSRIDELELDDELYEETNQTETNEDAQGGI